jgi:hypothetical protein
MPGAEPDELDETLEQGHAMAKAQEGEIATHADGVMVLSVWQQGTEGFLGRMTATTQDGVSTIKVVASQEELLQSVREWLDLLG